MNTKQLMELFHNINYMNINELKGFCDDVGIPYKINIESSKNTFKKTSEIDRKAIIIRRIKLKVCCISSVISAGSARTTFMQSPWLPKLTSSRLITISTYIK